MSLESIEKLREYADLWSGKRQAQVNLLSRNLKELADAIEQEASRAIGDAYTKGVTETLDNDNLLESQGWMRLPVDADDVPIREGDIVDWRDHSGRWHKNVSVTSVCDDGCYVIDGCVFHVFHTDIRQHEYDSWEQIISDAERLGDGWYDLTKPLDVDTHMSEYEALISRCKKLAGNEDE